MSAALELLTAVLILMNSTKDGDDLGLGRQRDGAGDLCIGALSCFDDSLCCLVDQLMVLGLEADADHVLVACHVVSPFSYEFFDSIGNCL